MASYSVTAPAPALDGFDAAISRLVPFARLGADASQLRARYQAGTPYPNLVLDGLFDAAVLDRVAREFPDRTPADWIAYDTANEIKRTSRGLLGVPPFAQVLLWQLCSEPFPRILRSITGVEDLVADPLFHGAACMKASAAAG